VASQEPSHLDPTFRIGIDVGGTFTDVVAVRSNEPPRLFKTPSTPSDPSEAVLVGLGLVADSYGLSLATLLGATRILIHGTTVATNTLIERNGARVGLLTTEGFRDILEVREGFKEDRYNLRVDPLAPLVPRHLRLTADERVRSDGRVERELDLASVELALDAFESQGVEALAVCFLFSFRNPAHERAVADLIRARFPDTFLSVSSEVLPQIKEFDRVSTTAVNSYVGPVYSRYLGKLGERLAEVKGPKNGPAGEMLIMQSSGGVMPLDESRQFPVRAILSGPAGGVSGAAYYGALVDEHRVIGLDMGGTSTDISIVVDGSPNTTGETFEAGWKIAVPMVDVTTLGAGGGSVASVDGGGILRVGPESAGADPGPACYGNGGTDPTVTDAALVSGYLDPSGFLGGRQSLNAGLAREAIGRLAAPLGLSPEEAASGVLEVVSTTVAEGIRVKAAQSGVDPRGFALVAFGGAAGLVAASVSRKLGVERVVVPAEGPLLSAYGMLSTDVRYDLSRSHPAELAATSIKGVRAVLGELAAEGHAMLGGRPELTGAAVRLSADMRYSDQMYEVNVSLPDLALEDSAFMAAWKDNLHRRYEELYSYSQPDLDISLVTLRATAVGTLPRIKSGSRSGPKLPAQSHTTRRVYIGDWSDVPVIRLDGEFPPDGVVGPAMLESDYNTVVLEAGDRAESDGQGGVRIAVAEQTDASDAPGATDPITTAVVERRLDSIAVEMMEVMLRTSLSQILNASRDYSTAILDAQGQLVAQGEGIPVHISALPIAGAAVRDYFGDDINDGDVFILNDPYFGGSHLPDVTILRPVFWEGELRYMTVNRAHHSDIGGGTHGGYNPSATEIFHEGLRLPPLRIVEKGRSLYDLLRMMSINTRYPEGFLGDLNAQMGSVEIAARRIADLLTDYGPERLSATVGEIMDAAESQVRQFISAWPDGEYAGETFVDDDGFDAKMIPIRATVTIRGDEMTVDLSGSGKQVTGFLNSAYANTRSIVHATVMYLAPSDLPKNEGSMRPVKVIAPKGLIVNALPPAPVTMSTNHVAEEIAEAMFLALADAVPHAVNAGFGRRLRYAITGADPRREKPFLWHFFLGRPGGGASLEHDGWSNVGELNSVGAIRAPSIEVTEDRFPLFVRRNELRPDSGGPGRRRGGLGSICEIVYEGSDVARLNTAGDGIINPPPGVLGGEPGLPHIYSIVSGDTETPLRSKQTGVLVKPGDVIRVLSAGGGGVGNPAEREPERVEDDRLNGYVT
jgi:5-oxoprolinase (ATP-hydrolysing)